MRQALLLSLTLFALIGGALANFQMRNLVVDITLNPDGSAHVQESLRMFIEGQQSIDLYEGSFVYNDLSSWRDRTDLEELQNHVTRAVAKFEEFRIRPQPVEGCNTVAKTCYATLFWEYNAYPISDNLTGPVKITRYKPRTSSYSLNTEALGFPRTKNNDIILSKRITLRITIPESATKIYFSKTPDNIPEGYPSRYDAIENKKYYIGDERTFSWSGVTLSQFEFSYEVEESLEQEILTFFSSLQQKMFDTLLSPEGAAIIFLFGLFVVSLISMHSFMRSSK